MSKHTPGPWKFGKSTNKKEIIILGSATPSGYICTVGLDIMLGPGWWIAEKKMEREANAQLITAAPELLEALQAICDAVDGKLTREEEMAVPDKARAAIAKATGQEV